MYNCMFCKDTRVCKNCKGTGKAFGGTGRLNCPHCKGSGACPHCSSKAPAAPQQPMYPQQPMAQQPMYPQQPMAQQPMYPQQPMAQQPMAQQPMYPQQPMAQQPMTAQQLQAASGEQQMEQMIQAFATGGRMKKLMQNQAGFLARVGFTGDMMKPLLTKIETGIDRERAAVCELLGIFGKAAKGGVISLAKALGDESTLVREKAAEALMKIGKIAYPAEIELIEATNDSNSNVVKFAKKSLKNFKKLSDSEKEQIKREELQERQFIDQREVYQQEIETAKAKLSPAATEFSQYKHVVFMSHALPDYNWVEIAINEIESWGDCYCWTCERDIQPGEDWLTEIYKGLEVCTWYILFWSDKAEQSKWTNEEIREAKTRNVQNGTPKVSVVNLGKDKWPTLLARAQGAMVKSEDDMRQYLANLKTQIGF